MSNMFFEAHEKLMTTYVMNWAASFVYLMTGWQRTSADTFERAFDFDLQGGKPRFTTLLLGLVGMNSRSGSSA
jgi:hypothetical protein